MYLNANRFYVLPVGNQTPIAYIIDRDIGQQSRLFFSLVEAYAACDKINALYYEELIRRSKEE